MKVFAQMFERVLERFMNIAVARVEAGLDIVAANAQRELLEEAARHRAECELGCEVIAKHLSRAAHRFDQSADQAPPGLPPATGVGSVNSSLPKSKAPGKGKRGRPRKVEGPGEEETDLAVPGTVVSSTELDKESA